VRPRVAALAAGLSCLLLVALPSCSTDDHPRLIYDADGSTNGSPPAGPDDFVHFGFGYFKAIGGPVQLWGIHRLNEDGLLPMGEGFLEVKSDNNLCEYTVTLNGHHPCPNLISLADRPVLPEGEEAFLVLTVQPTEEGKQQIGPVEVAYTSGDYSQTLSFVARDFIQTADPFVPGPIEERPDTCKAVRVDCD
jgi:hypothetical protein